MPSIGLADYLFPIKPGTTCTVTGTMGELRNTHFHAGLDIDTPSIGVPVLAVHDGYISKATCTTNGYGNVLFITHPDGNTTVYAHLEEFKGAVADFVRHERYARKVSEIELQFKPGQFPVSRGEVIAKSGNTGGSGGPHLHFEIRNSDNEAINPLVYGFIEVKDNVSPLAIKIALKTLDNGSRINDQFGRFEFSLIRSGTTFSLPHPILASGQIGVEILAHDKIGNTRFRHGINYIDMRVNDHVVFTQSIDKIILNESRRILTLMDYKVLELKGSRYNKLYIDDGNELDYYSGSAKENGIGVLNDETHVEVSLKDFNENISKVNFTLKPSTLVDETPLLGIMTKPYETEIHENTLKLTVKNCLDEKPIEIWQQGKATSLTASYKGKNQSVYLINLLKVLPDSIATCQGTVNYLFKDRIPSETDYNYYSDLVDIEFPDRALYDTTFLSVRYDTLQAQEIFSIGSRTVPLHHPIRVTLKPKVNYLQTRDLGMYRKEGNAINFVRSEWKNNRASFQTLSFGEFTILRDTVPPTIAGILINPSAARFRIKDNLSGIAYFEAHVNGDWLLMVYDYKSGYLKSEKRDKALPLKGEFELKVVDNAGNEKIFKQKIL